jgi:phage terminase large subunit
MRTKIEIPYNGWLPRDHQMALWQYLQDGGKRAMAIWHRRAGKDEVCLHHAAVSAVERVGNYWHMLPEYAQARKAIWTAINPHTGKRRIDEAFPVALRANTNDNEMLIRLANGSTFQCVGSDTYDTLVGSSCAGVVFSEYALSNPSAWGYLRPMLEENNGWAVFITTPRGHNHAKVLYDYARTQDDWFAELLTVKDTGAMSESELAETLQEYISIYGEDHGRSAFEQEYYCSFTGGLVGAFYAREMYDVRSEGRIISDLEALPDRPVHRAWDLGVRDDTSIWFFQIAGPQLRILDFYSSSGVGLDAYVEQIALRQNQYGWLSGDDLVPQDAKVRELGSGRTRVETMRSLGLAPVLVRAATINDGINAVRRTLPLCVFHSRCEAVGMSALEQYRREWNDDAKCFRASPLHDWTSNPADAFRYLSMGWRPQPRLVAPAPQSMGIVIPPPREPKVGGIVL